MGRLLKLSLVILLTTFFAFLTKAQTPIGTDIVKTKGTLGWIGYRMDSIKTYMTGGLGVGSVTSVAATVPTGLSVSGSPITTSGTLAITNNLAAGYVSSAGVSGAFTSSSTIPTSALTGTLTVPSGGTGVATVTGVLKGNGASAISAATAGTDYSAGTSALSTGILKSTTSTGALTIAVAGDFPTLNQNTTGTASGLSSTLAVASGGSGATTLTGYLKGNGTSAFTANATVPTTDLSGTVTNAQLANSVINANGSTLTLGAANTNPFTLANVTGVGATTSTASTFSGGLTSSGTTTMGAQVIYTLPAAVTTTSTLSTNSLQLVSNGASAITLTIPTGLTNGTQITLSIDAASTGVITLSSSENVFKTANTTSPLTNMAGMDVVLTKTSGYWAVN